MNIDPAAVLSVISEQATRIASLEHEIEGLRRYIAQSDAATSAQASPQ